MDVQDPDHRGDLVRTLSNVVRGRMQAMPQHVSLGCTSLVARALVRDAGSRITLRQMADDVWLREAATLVRSSAGELTFSTSGCTILPLSLLLGISDVALTVCKTVT